MQTVKMTLSRYNEVFENGYDEMSRRGFWRLREFIIPYKIPIYTIKERKKGIHICEHLRSYEDSDDVLTPVQKAPITNSPKKTMSDDSSQSGSDSDKRNVKIFRRNPNESKNRKKNNESPKKVDSQSTPTDLIYSLTRHLNRDYEERYQGNTNSSSQLNNMDSIQNEYAIKMMNHYRLFNSDPTYSQMSSLTSPIDLLTSMRKEKVRRSAEQNAMILQKPLIPPKNLIPNSKAATSPSPSKGSVEYILGD
eukprot:TRINITY_DN4025_c0_g1_i1.p1 TRINITY_DN4025_c0_g1~~TRINITY_DN4025_c0_g1_i1.p1  ORF type:complete len:250 (-),score=40.35 TRINITY_DN4025_c0_g1_i1:66-815(-)